MEYNVILEGFTVDNTGDNLCRGCGKTIKENSNLKDAVDSNEQRDCSGDTTHDLKRKASLELLNAIVKRAKEMQQEMIDTEVEAIEMLESFKIKFGDKEDDKEEPENNNYIFIIDKLKDLEKKEDSGYIAFTTRKFLENLIKGDALS
jgi:hypothetical protein